MIARSLQIIFAAFLLAESASAQANPLAVGKVHKLTFGDVDGNDLSTADGHVTIMTVVTRENEAKARTVAELVPDRCVGDPRYRYITLVNFQGKLLGAVHGLTRSIIRGRLDAEAKKLQDDYTAKQLTRDPRKDIYVIADFDSEAVLRLGLAGESEEIAVFVFDPAGKLIARWNDVPPGDSLPQAITAAE